MKKRNTVIIDMNEFREDLKHYYPGLKPKLSKELKPIPDAIDVVSVYVERILNTPGDISTNVINDPINSADVIDASTRLKRQYKQEPTLQERALSEAMRSGKVRGDKKVAKASLEFFLLATKKNPDATIYQVFQAFQEHYATIDPDKELNEKTFYNRVRVLQEFLRGLES